MDEAWSVQLVSASFHTNPVEFSVSVFLCFVLLGALSICAWIPGRLPSTTAPHTTSYRDPSEPFAESSFGSYKDIDVILDKVLDRHATKPGEGKMIANQMLEILWPYISEYAHKIIKDRVEPAVQKSLGAVGKQFHFDETHCDLGSKPFELNDLHATKTTQKTAEGEVENMVVTGDMKWEGNLSILTHFAHITLGIKSISLHGTLVMEFVGLRAAVPFFQGARAFFINPPALDMEFQGDRLATVLNLGAIKKKILEVVELQISKELVVPNRFGKVLDKSADYFRICKPRPRGILKLTVVQADGLLAMDHRLFQSDSSDPYAVIRCGAVLFKTPVMRRTLDPAFNFTVRIQIGSVSQQRLRIDFWDEDKLSHDDFLGKVEIPVIDAVSWGGNRHVCLDLADDTGATGRNGRVWLRAEWRPLVLQPLAFAVDDFALVFLGVYYARDVPLTAEDAKFRVVSQCSSMHSSFTTEGEQASKWFSPKMQHTRERKNLATQVALLQKYGVSYEDMAEVLNIPVDQLQSGTVKTGSFQVAEVQFNHTSEYLVEKASSAVVNIELRSNAPQSPTGHPNDDEPTIHATKPTTGLRRKSTFNRVGSMFQHEVGHTVGSHKFNVSDIAEAVGHTSVQEITLQGTNTHIKFRAQLRFLGTPSTTWP